MLKSVASPQRPFVEKWDAVAGMRTWVSSARDCGVPLQAPPWRGYRGERGLLTSTSVLLALGCRGGLLACLLS